ncbi:MAG: methyltransferase domain-containing protein [bacterium]|nr:methyltransferase domain-containing protein [bacterium]
MKRRRNNRNGPTGGPRGYTARFDESLCEDFLAEYMRDFAALAPDLLAPELQAYNTRRLNDLWKMSCERADAMTPLPFWGIVWPGSRALARYILDHPDEFRGLRTLDVATGSGLAAVAAAKVGATVTGIDLDPMGPKLAERTAQANDVAARCEWLVGDVLKLSDDFLNGFDVLIAGDVFYEEQFASDALQLVRRSLAFNQRNLLADPGRTHRPQANDKNADGLDISIVAEYRVPVYVDIEGIRERSTTLLSLSRAGHS